MCYGQDDYLNMSYLSWSVKIFAVRNGCKYENGKKQIVIVVARSNYNRKWLED